MTSDWPTTREEIIKAFKGEEPGAPLEAALVDLYEANPQAVLNAIPSIAKSLSNGKINSGWAVLKGAAAKKAVQQTNPTISREKLIRNADQWLRNAGLMYDNWAELQDELFGDRGRLRAIANDKLISRYHDAWDQIRPDGIEVEQDELARAAQWKTNHAKLAAIPKTTPLEEAAA